MVVASPSSVYGTRQVGLYGKGSISRSQKGFGFHQPARFHRHLHVDEACVNIHGTFYDLCRYVAYGEIPESMTQADGEMILQQARDGFPDATPRIISDNGPLFVAESFRQFIRMCGMTHVWTAPFYL